MEPRSHDSRYYGKRFMLRLDTATWERLEALSRHFSMSIAEVVRQLVAQTEIEDVPPTWPVAVHASRTPQDQGNVP